MAILCEYDLLQASQHAIFLCARIPQIFQNFSVSRNMNVCSVFMLYFVGENT